MIGPDFEKDFYKLQADPTPHSIGCMVTGPDGGKLYLGPQRWDKQVTDIRLYSDPTRMQEALVIRSRRLLDVTLVYDVCDPEEGIMVGSIHRVRHRSLLCDEWALIEGAHACTPGVVPMDSSGHAVLKRAFSGGYDNRFHIYVKGRRVGSIRECKGANGTIFIDTDFSADREGLLDRRLGVAAGVLLVVGDWS